MVEHYKSPAANKGFAIAEEQCFAETFLVAESFVLRINISAKTPHHRQYLNHYKQI